MVRKIVIIGAAGRDFHNFNVLYRGRTDVRVVAFTATQIPQIDDRRYPAALAGPGYPDGIPIRPEEDLKKIIRETGADQVVFSYSDVTHEAVMNIASRALAAGADFELISPRRTALAAKRPVVSVSAVRTGCGKSQVSLALVELLREKGLRGVALRHPMPYGDLARQAVQRFATMDDLDHHNCTIEEREEYEQYLARDMIIYAGVDYERILAQAEEEADVLLWDGGNNDTPFLAPDLSICLLDPLRAGHERRYHPGETNFLAAEVLFINKIDRAEPGALEALRATAKALNPSAVVIEARSEVELEDQAALRGKRVIVVEDGPTLTHGEMSIGAGFVAAELYEAGEIVDPRPYATGSIKEAYERYPHLGPVLPALGYYPEQLEDLRTTLSATPADVIVVGSPMNLPALIKLDKPAVRAHYRIDDTAKATLGELLTNRLL